MEKKEADGNKTVKTGNASRTYAKRLFDGRNRGFSYNDEEKEID